VTLLSIALGVYSKRARDQKRAVELIGASSHGSVWYDDDHWDTKTHTFGSNSIYPQWLRSALGRDFFQSVIYVQIEDAELLSQLKYLPNVRDVTVFDPKTADVHIKFLAGVPSLRGIIVRGCEGLDRDRCFTHVSNDSLVVLGQLPRIEKVYLFGQGFGPDGIAALTKARTLQDVGLYKSEGSFGDSDAKPFRELGTVKQLTLSANLNLSPAVRWNQRGP
jgi:hypothetical protein